MAATSHSLMMFIKHSGGKINLWIKTLFSISRKRPIIKKVWL